MVVDRHHGGVGARVLGDPFELLGQGLGRHLESGCARFDGPVVNGTDALGVNGAGQVDGLVVGAGRARARGAAHRLLGAMGAGR